MPSDAIVSLISMSGRPLILCADDDEDILALVSLRLERAGYEVACVGDGEAAVTVARARQPDAVVLDLMLPRRTGIEVLAELRRNPGLTDTKVLLLSARVNDGDVARGFDAGADAFLAKPFRAHDLVERIEQLLAA
jgi:DNA-binding response OmpR family regulator